MELTRDKLREDYPGWHRAQVSTDDIDPVYPVLRNLADRWGLTPEERAWLVVCHVVWYYPGSTLAAFSKAPSLKALPRTPEGLQDLGLLDLPTGTERRGHRMKQNLINHLLGLHETMPQGAWKWATEAVLVGSDDWSPTGQWLNLNEQLTTIRGNGRWAAYKTAEMFQKVCGLPVVASDAGHRYSSGPRKGLSRLEPFCPADNSKGSIAELDFMTELWADVIGEDDVALVETSLCDFNSLVGGRYYLGHDIDSMLETWTNPRVSEFIPPEAWVARSEVFDPALLGEINGWTGVRRDLKQKYKTTGNLS